MRMRCKNCGAELWEYKVPQHPTYWLDSLAGLYCVGSQRHVPAKWEDVPDEPEHCVRCGEWIHCVNGIWIDSTDGEGCADDEGREGVHTVANQEEGF